MGNSSSKKKKERKKTVENVRPSGFQRPRAVSRVSKYIHPYHVRVTEIREDVYEVEVLKEKLCVWVFSPLVEEREKEDFEDIQGVWQKIEREERAVVVDHNFTRNGIVFSFSPRDIAQTTEGVSEQV